MKIIPHSLKPSGAPRVGDDDVSFAVRSDGEAVPCQISEDALSDLGEVDMSDPHLFNRKQKAAIFDAHRAAIEEVAARRCAAGEIDKDGWIRITSEDFRWQKATVR